jgi:allene oxide cyclase
MKINLNLNPLLLVVCLVLLAILVSTSVFGQDSEGTLNLTVVERVTTDIVTDIGAEGDSVGDVLTFANEVYDETNTTLLGTDNGFCIRTVVGAAWECVWTLMLEAGYITVEGPFYDTIDSVFVVTGGTGAYVNARGHMLLTAFNEDATVLTFAYELQTE